MKASVAALVLLAAWLPAASARADGAAVLVLRGDAALATEEERLIEALRIYTRDRDGRLVTEAGAPAAPTSRAIAEAVARARATGAAIVVWAGRRADGGGVFYVLTAARAELRETEIAPLGAERTAVDVALKVRALLPVAAPAAPVAATPDAGPASEPPPRARPTAAAPAPARPPVAPAAPAGPPAALGRVAPVEAAPPPPARLALGAAYGVFLPSDSAWRRAGLALVAELRVGRVGDALVHVFVDGALTERPTRTVGRFAVTLGDTPVGAGALLRSHWGRWSAGVGPRASLHVLDLDAVSPAPDGRRGSSRRYAAGLGGRFELDLRLFAYMKVYLGASLEGLIPTQEFTLAGQNAFSTGRVLAGFSAGLCVLIL